ncbi:esterase family protein [Hymenobacter sp. NBH84]|uniref:alpha/beta hydrolase n=1 Tax=Hymenobacter sp. NBH84 TaxID=2596915 RepID=UPI00162525F7|nr:alpha/beta hydrolase-fold protein [Hymenobacter sp. NBH84]QNE39580.1 esterase family protein [Hymenobacter sp. NBH84]
MNQPVPLPTQNTAVTVVRRLRLASRALRRTVRFDVVLPPSYDAAAPAPYPVLYLNDGQDLRRLHLPATLNALYRHRAVRPFVLVAIQAGVRVQEYGTAAYADYLGRGSRAKHYTEFLLTEMLPYAQARYHVSANPAEVVVAGFSLSGLAAFDFVWHHPEAALRAGVFSGSFWWRRRALDQGYTDADRLMHLLVREGQPAPGQQFWLQTGTLDETNDRNNNGIIDAIEDTLDLMMELEQHGLHSNREVRYVEVVDGRHNQVTWGRILPDFFAMGLRASGDTGVADIGRTAGQPPGVG